MVKFVLNAMLAMLAMLMVVSVPAFVSGTVQPAAVAVVGIAVNIARSLAG